MLAAFQLYGPAHLSALAILIIFTAALVRWCRKGENLPHTRISMGILAFCCFAAFPINQIVWLNYGDNVPLDSIVPLHLCDIAAFFCGFALITRKDYFCELSYFWGLAGTLQGLLTPNLAYGFPHPIFMSFFLHHSVIVCTALVLPLGLGWCPTQGAVKRAFIGILCYAVMAMIANYLMDTNYGFLARKPNEASLLDIMPEWPFYIFILIGLALFMFWLLALPFRNKHTN